MPKQWILEFLLRASQSSASRASGNRQIAGPEYYFAFGMHLFREWESLNPVEQ